ncbi:MAG: hypothetical protein KatS3mg060_2151 [Dehalococcoidia bacterium]|nr:MAG: hypothetical protein KatS3mg060_2151 [Dehalococcoidia bacterium]
MSARPYPALAAAGVATAVATLLLLLAAALPPTPIDAATPGRGWANRANALAGMAIFWAGFAGAAVGALGRWHGVRQEATRAGLVLVALLPPLIGASAIAVAGLSVTLPSGLAFGLIASVPTAICYAIVRLLAVAIGAWNRLRTRRLLWALTHAQLVVAIVLAFVTATVLVIVDAQGRLSTTNGTTLVAEIVIEVLPGILAIGVVSVLLFGAIVPPVAAISYVVLRRVTRRIDNLVDTTAALRSGKLETRTPVDGEDEIGRLQADFNAMADELERLVRETEGQRDTLQRLLTERRELVAAVSHELRTPVATMAAALESALAHDDPTALRQDLALLASETARLGRLIDDLFTLARAELGQLPLTIEPLDPAALLSRCVHVAAPLAWQHGRVEVVCETPPGLPPRAGRRR